MKSGQLDDCLRFRELMQLNTVIEVYDGNATQKCA